MKQRGIKRGDINKLLANPSRIRHVDNNKFIYWGSEANSGLAVVLNKERDRIQIITAYYENNL